MRTKESLKREWREFGKGHISFDEFKSIYEIGYCDGEYHERFWDYCDHHCKNKTDDCETKCEKRKQYLKWCEE